MQSNLDTKTIEGFGAEWRHFDQAQLDEAELKTIFGQYFSIFPWGELPSEAVGFDLGCGSGRWAKLVADRVGKLYCIDASNEALGVARRNLTGKDNVEFHNASVDAIPLGDASMDFGYSLGVLHHVPNTVEGLKACVQKLKPGAPLLIYLYYAFDNRPIWFRTVWKTSDVFRRIVAALPFRVKKLACDLIATSVYFPLARVSRILENFGLNVDVIPLSIYRRHSFYTMRTDALDRFGTRLEQRFTRREISEMMAKAGLERIVFSNDVPYWCACGFKKLS